MKTTHTKSIMLLVSAALLLTASIVGTFAYLTDNSGPVTNQFDPVNVPPTVVETFDGETKSNVKIENTGNIPAYIRAAIVVNWVRVDEKGNVTIYGEAPTICDNPNCSHESCGKDAVLLVNTGTDSLKWTKNNGYYYHNGSVAGNGGETCELITTCSPVDGKAPDGYQLSVEILAQSIQAEPDAAVQEAWGMSYSNGSWTVVNSN